MSNVVNLHGEKRWKAVIEYAHGNGPINIEHFLEELTELQDIVQHGPDLNTLTRCTITLNRFDDGNGQNRMPQARREHR